MVMSWIAFVVYCSQNIPGQSSTLLGRCQCWNGLIRGTAGSGDHVSSTSVGMLSGPTAFATTQSSQPYLNDTGSEWDWLLSWQDFQRRAEMDHPHRTSGWTSYKLSALTLSLSWTLLPPTARYLTVQYCSQWTMRGGVIAESLSDLFVGLLSFVYCMRYLLIACR